MKKISLFLTCLIFTLSSFDSHKTEVKLIKSLIYSQPDTDPAISRFEYDKQQRLVKSYTLAKDGKSIDSTLGFTKYEHNKEIVNLNFIEFDKLTKKESILYWQNFYLNKFGFAEKLTTFYKNGKDTLSENVQLTYDENGYLTRIKTDHKPPVDFTIKNGNRATKLAEKEITQYEYYTDQPNNAILAFNPFIYDDVSYSRTREGIFFGKVNKNLLKKIIEPNGKTSIFTYEFDNGNVKSFVCNVTTTQEEPWSYRVDFEYY